MNQNTNSAVDIQASQLKEKIINQIKEIAKQTGVEIPGVSYSDIDAQLSETNNWLALQLRKLELLNEQIAK